MPDNRKHDQQRVPAKAMAENASTDELTGKFRSVDLSGVISPEESTGKMHPLPAAGPPAVTGYEIVGELGRGGMGVVYKAWEVAAKRFVALKMLIPDRQVGAVLLRRFRAEAEVIARLRHSHIVQLYSIGEHHGRPYLLMEFCAGGSLAKKMAGTPMAPASAALLTEKLARAIAVAHDQQIIHRDLKPGNILLTNEGEPKISDFGLAKKLDEQSGQSQVGVVMGTPSYIAPEQAEGHLRQVGPATDIYALGAILYEALTGRPPFKGASDFDTLRQIRTQEIIAPRSFDRQIPRDLEAICCKCLQKQPGLRYRSASELADDLEHFRLDRDINPNPRGIVARVMTRYPKAIAAIVVFMLIAVFIIFGLAYLPYWR